LIVTSTNLAATRLEYTRTIKLIGKQAREGQFTAQLQGRLPEEYDVEKPAEWENDELLRFAHDLRHLTKPMIIAANKVDKFGVGNNLALLEQNYPELMIVACSADSELALKEASKAGLIEYVPGNGDFVVDENKVNEKQKHALDKIKKRVLEEYGSTGVQEVLDKVVFVK